MIHPKKPGSQQRTRICLGDVIYCPDFHLNLVSYSRLHKRQMFWDPARGMLNLHGQDVCSVDEHKGLFLLERNEHKKLPPLPQSSITPQSRMPCRSSTCQSEGVPQFASCTHFVGHVGPMTLEGDEFGQLHPRPKDLYLAKR